MESRHKHHSWTGREIVKKQREAIHHKAVRDTKRKIMEQRFLKGKQSKKVSRILTEVPEIGEEIENLSWSVVLVLMPGKEQG